MAKPKTIIYKVNGEDETSTVDELTVRQILENAGFQPAEEFTLKSENPLKDYGEMYDEVVDIHPNQRFEALHKGPTPTS